MRRPKPKSRAVAPSRPSPSRIPWPDLCVYLLLILATLAVYAQVRGFDFVNYDDPEYVSENRHALEGLTSKGLAWALTSGDDGYWFPVTRLSYLADIQFFALRSGWHHLTSVLIHLLTSLLVFALFKSMTGAHWRSGFVAGVFALHPLHVESVAWIAERKDVLSALFWFLAMWTYVRYARRPGLGRYALLLLAFSLGLMSKPMIVTLPFALLLLDVWPLRRAPLPGLAPAGGPSLAPILLEKVPLVALSVGAGLATLATQTRAGAVTSLASIPFAPRLANALVSYGVYTLKTFWPARLAAFYPYSRELPAWQVAAAALALAGVSWAALRWLRPRPYIAVGWFWYLGTLIPVIGLAQAGAVSRADRFTYIPMAGISIVLAWGAADLADRWPRLKRPVAGLLAAGCAACLAVSSVQTQYWRNSATLFRHAVEVTTGNYVAYNNLGLALRSQGSIDEAIACFREALRIRPRFVDPLVNLADASLEQGRLEDAIGYSSQALRLDPASAEAHVNLGIALGRLGRAAEAEAHLREALRLQPENAEAHTDLGLVLSSAGKLDEAIAEFSTALRFKPDYPNARFQLGAALVRLGRLDEGIASLNEALRLQPDNAQAHHTLGIALASQDKTSEAVAHFAEAVRLRPGWADAEFNLGAALANSGRPAEAAAHFSEALRIRPDFEPAREGLVHATAASKGSARR